MSTAPTDTKKKPGRRAETPAERLARAQQELEQARIAVREQEERGLLVLARALMEEAKADATFMDTIREVTRRRVTGRSSLALIAPLFELAVVTPAAAKSKVA